MHVRTIIIIYNQGEYYGLEVQRKDNDTKENCWQIEPKRSIDYEEKKEHSIQ
jgi:hypothetical protein